MSDGGSWLAWHRPAPAIRSCRPAQPLCCSGEESGDAHTAGERQPRTGLPLFPRQPRRVWQRWRCDRPRPFALNAPVSRVERATVCAEHREALIATEVQECHPHAHAQVVLNRGRWKKHGPVCSECKSHPGEGWGELGRHKMHIPHGCSSQWYPVSPSPHLLTYKTRLALTPLQVRVWPRLFWPCPALAPACAPSVLPGPAQPNSAVMLPCGS